MDESDLTGLQLDVYMTREGPWDPDHGDLEIPDDWEFLASGDAFVTRRVKAAGTYWVAWRPRGRNRPHRRRLGLWAPKEAIEAAQAEAVATEDQRAQQRVYGARSREKQEAGYRVELEDAIRRFLAFAPDHRDLADEIAEEAARRAAEVGSGRVGRTRTLSLEERASLAARALIRHQYTTYEDDISPTSRWRARGTRSSGIARSRPGRTARLTTSSTATGRRRVRTHTVDPDRNPRRAARAVLPHTVATR